MRVSTALNMLRDHGCKAFVCAEGVVAIGEAVWRDAPADDNMTEEATTFTIFDPNGDDTSYNAVRSRLLGGYQHVDANAIRDYLGY